MKNSVEEGIYKLNCSRNVASIISSKAKNKQQPLLTVQDVELLFPMTASAVAEDPAVSAGSLAHLPPAVAAGLAAERRLMESRKDAA